MHKIRPGILYGHFLHKSFVYKLLKGSLAYFLTCDDISADTEILSETDLMGVSEILVVNRHCVNCLRHRLQALAERNRGYYPQLPFCTSGDVLAKTSLFS